MRSNHYLQCINAVFYVFMKIAGFWLRQQVKQDRSRGCLKETCYQRGLHNIGVPGLTRENYPSLLRNSEHQAGGKICRFLFCVTAQSCLWWSQSSAWGNEDIEATSSNEVAPSWNPSSGFLKHQPVIIYGWFGLCWCGRMQTWTLSTRGPLADRQGWKPKTTQRNARGAMVGKRRCSPTAPEWRCQDQWQAYFSNRHRKNMAVSHWP